MLIPHLSFLAQAPEGDTLLGPYANIRAWIERMEARPSLRNTTWDRLAAMVAAA
jgi:glutathione S-transferase